MATADENNLKIPSMFTRDYYQIWEDHVIQHPQQQSQNNIDKLALLCIVNCKHKSATSGDCNYERNFFDLLCTALGSGSTYRSKDPEAAHPRLFKSAPEKSDKAPARFSHIWPIKFNSGDTDSTTDTCYVGIPIQYLKASSDPASTQPGNEEEGGALCAILYLTMSDAVASFLSCANSKTRVDCPCLLDYFRRSPLNNQNQLTSLIGEYLALLKFSFLLPHDETWRFMPVESDNDFEIATATGAEQKFSVKTDNRSGSLRHFRSEIRDPSTRARPRDEPHTQPDDAILILNCSCQNCKQKPIVKLTDIPEPRAAAVQVASSSESCRRENAQEIINDLYGSSDRGTHYVMSVSGFFDLRFAMQSFSYRQFRSATGVDIFRDTTPSKMFTALFTNMSINRELENWCLKWCS